MRESFHNDAQIEALEFLEKEGVIRKAAAHIGAEIHEGAFDPVADARDIARIRKISESADRVLDSISDLIKDRTFDDVPPREDFFIVHEQYRGADGKVRTPLPKYVPKHIWPHFKNMQERYHQWLDGLGGPSRPGLVIQSAYRSPYYQMGVMARTMDQLGIANTLSRFAIPGFSQHADYARCAIDIQNIGDRYGKATREDGTPVDFSETIEFDWLIHEAPKDGFWFSYHPNNERMSGTGTDGIIVEPWHVQFREDAELLMSQNHVRSLFRMRRQKLVSDRELKVSHRR